jgi:hypothetical protein
MQQDKPISNARSSQTNVNFLTSLTPAQPSHISHQTDKRRHSLLLLQPHLVFEYHPLNRTSNIEHLSALSTGRRRHRTSANTEQLTLVGSKYEALTTGISLATLLAIGNRLNARKLAQWRGILVATGGRSSASIALLLAGWAVGAVLALGVCVRRVCACWVGGRGLHGRHARAGFVECNQVGAALAGDLRCGRREEKALDGGVDHAEDKGLALRVCCAEGLTGLGCLDVAWLGDGGCGSGAGWRGAAGCAGEEGDGGGAYRGEEGEGGEGGDDVLHFDVVWDWVLRLG